MLVVEHDEDTIRAADFVVDLGPGAGRAGGEVVAAGSLEDVMAEPDSVTGAYLRGDMENFRCRSRGAGRIRSVG